MSVPPRLPPPQPLYQGHWIWILCVIGLDYMSTLGYQPSIAYRAAGTLAPLATVVVVLVTLFAALPVYAYVAGRSFNGQGSFALLERLLPGWTGKLLILGLLGFAATDLIFTRTFSAADASEHLLRNPHPLWQSNLDALAQSLDALRERLPEPVARAARAFEDRQLVVTLLLLLVGLVVGLVFRHGIGRRMVQISVATVGLYLLLNAIVIGSGLAYLVQRPELLDAWRDEIASGRWRTPAAPPTDANVWPLVAACLLLFPSLTLGVSGFELTLTVMPLVKGDPGEDPAHPRGRVRNTRKLLVAAALIMSVYLLGSALVTALLIPPDAFTAGRADYRALAYLAHGGALADGQTAETLNPLFGTAFGTLYDLSTIVVLCLAGVSVSIGLRDLVPPYLHRLGMELEWSYSLGLLLYVFTLVKLLVTIAFDADPEAQRGAYATSVLVLMASAGLSCVLDRWRRKRGALLRLPWFFGLVTLGFATAAGTVVLTRPQGLPIAASFIATILITSILTRAFRSTELRFHGFTFSDEGSRFLWESLKVMDFPILVPHRPGGRSLAETEERIRQRHRLPPEMPVVFLESELGDASDFYCLPRMDIVQEDGRFVIRVTRCASVPHVIAAVALELSRTGVAPEVHFGWSHENPLTANLHFVLFGHGNVPWMVHELIRKAEPDPARRPRVIVG